ncbi:MAG: DUF1015 domain-containing protein [Candidatus Dormiibacterota bacterium]
MADVQPFRGVTYDPERVDLASVLSPPYDVISPEQQEAYYGRDPHNVVRIVLNREEGDGRYAAAAKDLQSWLADGVLRQDEQPALYVHRHTFASPDGGGRISRTGLIAAVRVEPWEKGKVKPHEHTMPGPKEDRLRLLEATGADTEPIWVFHPDLGDAMATRLKRVVKTEPDLAADFVAVEASGKEADPERHELWRVDGREMKDLALVASEMQLYIADGHHRYETALHHAKEARQGRDDPSRFKLTLISQLQDPGLLVLPTHRLIRVPEGFSLGEALGTLSQRGWKWVPAVDTAELLDLLAAAPGPNNVGFGLYAAGRRSYWEGMIVGPEVELLPKSVAALDVALVHHGILAPLLGVGEGELAAGTHVAYARDAGEVISRVDSGEFDCGMLLRAPTLAQIKAVADAGESMPQKSTYFWPKPASGLVMALQTPESRALPPA